MSRSFENIKSTVRELVKNADLEACTLKSIRSEVESRLNLEKDSLKEPVYKDFVRQTVDEALTALDGESIESIPPKKRKSSNDPPKDAEVLEPSGKKRKGMKHEKLVENSKATSIAQSVEDAQGPRSPSADGDENKSDMSVLIDEPTKPRKKRTNKMAKDKPDSQITAAVKKNPKKISENEVPSLIEEEIKKYKQQLRLCGYIKHWQKELAPYGTDKAKVKYLKSILVSLGITGRFSKERAQKVKEEREFQADVASLQQDEEERQRVDRKQQVPDKIPGEPAPKGIDFGFLGNQSSDE
ncbi:HIRA-interacting protein 3 [Neolecta irregularis DAH-3]|uniref:HIRA-interacting protein 3 n=1 Tax=Neolecta irregularis (strain DAH-3) TaxID=1198029 RepID=A0A1U7LIW7_NEOID|nr:HIRA-interacting protein 3 [Neolecta irregularis DAH-3]|eukprot:OLL22492.1 HIRA-interacting protein 3 [Neolecta irregularis DAH-3]